MDRKKKSEKLKTKKKSQNQLKKNRIHVPCEEIK